jgi:hypothetical protein
MAKATRKRRTPSRKAAKPKVTPYVATYREPIDDHYFEEYGSEYTVAQFRQHVAAEQWTDASGYGHPMKERVMDRNYFVKPSRVDEIPKDATHIMWYDGGQDLYKNFDH